MGGEVLLGEFLMGEQHWSLRHKWTEEREGIIRRLHALNFSTQEIADKLNELFDTTYSKNAIIGKLHRMRMDGKL